MHGNVAVKFSSLLHGANFQLRGRGAPSLFWVKKEEMTEGRKAGWASEIKPVPLFSSKSGSATAECHFGSHDLTLWSTETVKD